jgi:hypothetical protein
MPNHSSTTARVTAVQSYLEEEFPGCVEAARKHVIVVSHDGIRHRVVLQPSFLHLCPDYMRALRESELTDSLREARSHARRFIVTWHAHDTRIRSTPLRGCPASGVRGHRKER